MRSLRKPAASPAVLRAGLVAASAAALAVAASAGSAIAAQPAHTSARISANAPVHAIAYAPVYPSMHGRNFASDSPWGGYVATGSGFRSIVGSWIEPAVTCTSTNNLFAPWVGIDGYGSNTVEQTGAQVSCSTDRPVYSAWYEMYPKNPVYLSTSTYPVAANDSFTGTVTTAGSGSYTLTLTDNTKGWTYTTTQRLSADNISAEAIIESPTSSYPKFTATQFSGITVNGKTFSSYNPIALSSGGYSPTALSGGSFELVP
jgi:Peptidase A4 family